MSESPVPKAPAKPSPPTLGEPRTTRFRFDPRRNERYFFVPKKVFDRSALTAPGQWYATVEGGIPRLQLFPADDRVARELSECLEALRTNPIRWDETGEPHADRVRRLRRIHTVSVSDRYRVVVPRLLASLAQLSWKEGEEEIVVFNLGTAIIEVYSHDNYQRDDERLRVMSKHEGQTLAEEFWLRGEANE